VCELPEINLMMIMMMTVDSLVYELNMMMMMMITIALLEQ